MARDPEGLAAQEHGPRVLLVRWTDDGIAVERLHHALYVKCREQAAREASPTAAIIDAQSCGRAAEKGGLLDQIRTVTTPARRSRARRRCTPGRHPGFSCCTLIVTAAADIQDRDRRRHAAGHLVPGMFPFLRKFHADGGLSGAGVPEGAEACP